tara:strand:- start:36 stop:248 length:213 start_codon:yes stop_codon:yes gene_type:complete
MSNMSYCRFENTTNDLGDCIEAIRDWEDECKDLSDYELSSLKDLLIQAREIIELEDDILDIIEYNENNEE